MSDVNVLITTVDKTIDLLDKYHAELSDIYACGLFDIESTGELIRRKCADNQDKIERLEKDFHEGDYKYESEMPEADLSYLYCKQSALEDLRSAVITLCDEKKENWSSGYRRCTALVDYGKQVMLEYIVKLNDISLADAYSGITAAGNKPDYYVIVVDSKKYPQTAEHIQWAIRKGMPEFVTLGRKEASQRRKDSLRNVKISPVYDRDEWPMACFVEGGTGADVFYLDKSDNRGAGASIRHQMKRLPDGARLRIRIL